MTKSKQELDLIPRVSILETSQQAIAKDLSNLTHSVQRQGEQLTSAITQLSANQNANYSSLAEKIGAANTTDWQSFWSMIAVVFVAISFILAPLYIMHSNAVDVVKETKDRVSALEKAYIDDLKNDKR